MSVEMDDINEDMDGGQQIKSVAKACALLNILLSSQRPMRITDLASRLRSSPSGVSRLVSTLAANGMVEQDEETGRCYLGLGLALLGNAAVGRRDIDRIAHPVMAEIVTRLNEYISLGRLHRGKVVLVRSKNLHTLQRDVDLMSVIPLHASAPGKMLAAWLSQDEVLAILKTHGMDPYTPRTITTVDAFMEELAKIRQAGFSLDDAELIHGLRHVACAIRDHNGVVVATISAGGRARDLVDDHLEEVVQAISHGALEISRQLGYVDPIVPRKGQQASL
jgi:DNA-binding IclR family transcriptional regulator